MFSHARKNCNFYEAEGLGNMRRFQKTTGPIFFKKILISQVVSQSSFDTQENDSMHSCTFTWSIRRGVLQIVRNESEVGKYDDKTLLLKHANYERSNLVLYLCCLPKLFTPRFSQQNHYPSPTSLDFPLQDPFHKSVLQSRLLI